MAQHAPLVNFLSRLNDTRTPGTAVLGGDREPRPGNTRTSKSEAHVGIAPTLDAAREHEILQALQQAGPDGGPPSQDWSLNRRFRFRLGPSVELVDGRGVCSPRVEEHDV